MKVRVVVYEVEVPQDRAKALGIRLVEIIAEFEATLTTVAA